MSANQLRAAKAQLRRQMQERLAALSPPQARLRSTEIIRRVLATEAWDTAEIVLAFVSLPGEVGTAQLCRAAIEDAKVLGLPRVTPGGLVFHRVDNWPFTAVRSAYGINEPAADSALLTLTAPSNGAVVSGEEEACPRLLVITPGLAFDRDGGRLGRGGAYYDRLFASLEARPDWSALAVGFDFQLVDRVPCGETDRRVHAVAIENELVAVVDR